MNYTRALILLAMLCLKAHLEAQQPVLHKRQLPKEANQVNPLILDIVHIKNGTCGRQDGSIEVCGKGGIPPYQYALDGQSFQLSNKFAGLPKGSHTIYVMDEAGGIGDLVVSLENNSDITRLEPTIHPTSCGEDEGEVSVEISGGTPPVLYALDDQPFQISPVFGGLSAGIYDLHIIDASGCRLDTTLNIERTGCPIYIPNIFTPNGDGTNDVFKLETVDEKNVLIRRFFIFDRWGNNVFEKYNFYIHEQDVWWDGMYKRFTMDRGQFAYYIEAEFENGDREVFKGNVTLIR